MNHQNINQKINQKNKKSKINDREHIITNEQRNIKITRNNIDIYPYRLCCNTRYNYSIKKKILICKSKIHGFGCFAGENIGKHEFITEYLGEIITQNEANNRGKIYDKLNISYLFNLNQEYVVDATRKGNKIKYSNHSNKPNCIAKIINSLGKHKILIFALKDIDVGHELLFDYHHNIDETYAQPKWLQSNEQQ